MPETGSSNSNNISNNSSNSSNSRRRRRSPTPPRHHKRRGRVTNFDYKIVKVIIFMIMVFILYNFLSDYKTYLCN